jgi:hypothetical protein
MAGELTLTAAQVAAVYPDKAEIVDMIAGATITAGQAVYQTTAGKAGVADANGSGTLQFRGIALRGGAAGQVIPVLKRGHCAGFSVSATNCDTALYLSDTAGSIATSAGSTSIGVGRVVALPDATRVVYVEADWLRTWS